MYIYVYIYIHIGAHYSSPTQSITVMYIDTNVSVYHMYIYVYIYTYIGAHYSSPSERITVSMRTRRMNKL